MLESNQYEKPKNIWHGIILGILYLMMTSSVMGVAFPILMRIISFLLEQFYR